MYLNIYQNIFFFFTFIHQKNANKQHRIKKRCFYTVN